MTKAIFLDRDGVIINNEKHYYIFKPEDVVLVDGIVENLKLLKANGFELFIVSNQGGIAKKLYGFQQVSNVHRLLIKHFAKHQIAFRDIYYCPHHDSVEKCLCRKPSPLMIEKLAAKHSINLSQSAMIGDRDSDLQTAKAAGVKGIKIEANQNMLPFIQELI